jgi:hypothetical protein
MSALAQVAEKKSMYLIGANYQRRYFPAVNADRGHLPYVAWTDESPDYSAALMDEESQSETIV